MSVFAPTKLNDQKVHNSQYIRTENEDKTEEAEVKPAEAENTESTESK